MEISCKNKNNIFVIINILNSKLKYKLIYKLIGCLAICMYAWSILYHKRLDKMFINLGRWY